MKPRSTILVLLGLLLTFSYAQASIVAFKRSPGLTLGSGLSSSFATAISGGTITVYSGAGVAADTFLYTNTSGLIACVTPTPGLRP